MSNRVYEIVTEQMIKKLDEGIVPWHMPWKQDGSVPTNLISKKPYRGVNHMMLWGNTYASQYYVTFRQCKALGGSVRAGEHGHTVVFWKFFDAEGDDENNDEPRGETRKRIPMLRYYTVFNVEQCEIDPSKIPSVQLEDFDPIERCENVVASMPNAPAIREGEARAYYRPSTDTINMPKKGLFEGAEHYYATLYHELTHSTGHPSRLNRDNGEAENRFGSNDYAKEELIAEMGAAYLCAECHIDAPTIDNSAAYIQSWIRRFRQKPRLLVSAAGKAQKAADYILGTRLEF